MKKKAKKPEPLPAYKRVDRGYGVLTLPVLPEDKGYGVVKPRR